MLLAVRPGIGLISQSTDELRHLDACEFNEPLWRDWMSLSGDFQLDWRSFDEATFKHCQRLIALRKEHAALRQGAVHFVDSGASGLLHYWRNAGRERVLVAVNLREKPCALPDAFAALQRLYSRAFDGKLMGAYGCAIAIA